MPNPSPLRYPGGKYRLANFISLAIKNLCLHNCTYIEPFAGGAGIAMYLLFNGIVENVVINDYDKAIYSFWRAVKQEHNALIEKIIKTPITINEWYKQRDIYLNSKSYSVDLAFATLFLNRTNHSGILNAGPIGGYKQSGIWKLNARFNKYNLIEKINMIANYKQHIHVYNKDIISFLNKYGKNFGSNAFYYFDPPYYNKGQKLYKNFFTHQDHKRIHDVITTEAIAPWIITYDDVKEIAGLYSEFYLRHFDLTYSAANKGIASELMIFSDIQSCPTGSQLSQNKIMINLRP